MERVEYLGHGVVTHRGKNRLNSHEIGFRYNFLSHFQIQIHIQIFLNTDKTCMSLIRISIKIFTQFNSKCILLNLTYMNRISNIEVN